ncbi:MAG: ribosomal L7Ae/L30e/S12e/Gadd45 family protein [Candidatus Aenigmatarchaeota archaeon]
MAKTVEKEIKDAMGAKRLAIGSRTVLRGLKRGSLKSVVYATNCPEGTRKDLNHYATLSKIEVKEFGGDSSRLGELCGKPFNILAVGVKK